MNKIYFIVSILFFLFCLYALSDIALAKNYYYPEPKYFDIFKSEISTITKISFPEYVKYIFNFVIFLSGFIAATVLAVSGLQYIASTGKPEKISQAKKRIFSF